MGAAISTSTTPGEVAASLVTLGAAYEAYAPIVVDNCVDGACLLSFSTKEEIAETLVDLGVTNKAHQRVLVGKILAVVEAAAAAAAAAASEATAEAAAASEAAAEAAAAVAAEAAAASAAEVAAAVAEANALRPSLQVLDTITLHPRQILCQMFDIHALEVDPEKVRDEMARIVESLRERGACDGWADGVSKYDCFLSYRRSADKEVARQLYLTLKAFSPPIHAFLDEFCLVSGEPWKDGFIRGLHASRCFVAIMSAAALSGPRDSCVDHSRDNVLIEYETALRISSETNNPRFILPLFVGVYETFDGRRFLAKFMDGNLNPGMYSDSVAARPRDGLGANAARTAPAGTGKRIWDAAKVGDMASLRPLVQEWSGHDVLNWANPDHFGYTPLIIGSNDGMLEAVQLLLATPGLDVNHADDFGWTATSRAVFIGHTEIVGALLAAPGIDVNKADNDGWTATMLAACEGHTEVVRALLAAPGVDLNMRATGGREWARNKTALGFAVHANKVAAAALLREAGGPE